MSKIIIKTAYFFLLIAWYILVSFEYSIYRILPIVQMGERSWPLLFFLIDGLALFITGLYIFILVLNFRKNRRFSIMSFLWLLAALLLIYPLLMIYAAYSDLTQELCKEHKNQTGKCVKYIPPPDLRNIKFTWEKSEKLPPPPPPPSLK